MDKIEAELFEDMALKLLGIKCKPDRLQAAIQRAEEVATRRDIPVEDWLA